MTRLVNGVDIVDIRRIEKILSTREDKFLKRFFTRKERSYIKSKGNRANTIAGMFAGKEAISKALGTGIGRVTFKDMEITHTDKGQPLVELREEIINEFKIKEMTISISHEKNYAVAFVVGRVES